MPAKSPMSVLNRASGTTISTWVKWSTLVVLVKPELDKVKGKALSDDDLDGSAYELPNEEPATLNLDKSLLPHNGTASTTMMPDVHMNNLNLTAHTLTMTNGLFVVEDVVHHEPMRVLVSKVIQFLFKEDILEASCQRGSSNQGIADLSFFFQAYHGQDAKGMSKNIRGLWYTKGRYIGVRFQEKEDGWYYTLKELQASGYTYISWDGCTPHVIADSKLRVVVILAGQPSSPTWPSAVKEAMEALVEADKDICPKGNDPVHHGAFPALAVGVSYRGG
ncbi:hypothetical protein HYDPIDRAFT_168194 [Hydnomerulius pinastri MD-312]|uniref:Uncharacterized protein n=1 Tax=Hydnomerulius pinastri MD-312 TaxID=994086 RepID=A0A0C9VF61_9AGAM|nr:hypothetical protein HYDPIDRAFT_168194 [Hydnomerulius pinastri MD-312]